MGYSILNKNIKNVCFLSILANINVLKYYFIKYNELTKCHFDHLREIFNIDLKSFKFTYSFIGIHFYSNCLQVTVKSIENCSSHVKNNDVIIENISNAY